MTLNTINLRDLIYICELARERLAPKHEPVEWEWLARIDRYKTLFEFEIYRLEAAGPAPGLVPEVDPLRVEWPSTDIYVRARLPSGEFASVDIAQLTRASLLVWLRSRGGENQWAENTVLHLLDYEGAE